MNTPTDSRIPPQPSEDGWEPCAPGQLAGLAQRLNTQQRRGQQLAAVKTAGAVGLMTALLVVGGGLLMGSGASGPMFCQECVANFDAYDFHLSGQQPMDAVTLERMENHLAKCDLCRAKFEQEHPGLLSSIRQAVDWLIATISQPFFTA